MYQREETYFQISIPVKIMDKLYLGDKEAASNFDALKYRNVKGVFEFLRVFLIYIFLSYFFWKVFVFSKIFTLLSKRS